MAKLACWLLQLGLTACSLLLFAPTQEYPSADGGKNVVAVRNLNMIVNHNEVRVPGLSVNSLRCPASLGAFSLLCRRSMPALDWVLSLFRCELRSARTCLALAR